MRSDAQHRVSNDGPARAVVSASSWNILRGRCAAPQDEGRSEAYGKGQTQRQHGPRRALAETGPCFAVSETSGMLQMISRLGNRLAFAIRRRRCSLTMFRTLFRSGMSSGDGVSTLVAPGSSLVRRSHGYPVFLPPFGQGGVCVAFTLPVHDDAMSLCPQGAGCQITIRAPRDPERGETSPVGSRLRPRRSPSC